MDWGCDHEISEMCTHKLIKSNIQPGPSWPLQSFTLGKILYYNCLVWCSEIVECLLPSSLCARLFTYSINCLCQASAEAYTNKSIILLIKL